VESKYKEAGVDIQAGNEAVRRIIPLARMTQKEGSSGSIGGFGGVFRLGSLFKRPVLVAGADGVGTKLRIAFMMGVHHTVGIDCVAMNVNDVVVQGAAPLFFLDYIACGSLSPDVIERIVSGVARGCIESGCVLLGGETAEMPGHYPPGEYDLAGFAVGGCEEDELLEPASVRPGDVVIGLASSGLHSNGYSLARHVLLTRMSVETYVPELGSTLGEAMLTPTRIYVKTVLEARHLLRSAAHITGGGFFENIPRALPPGTGVKLERKAIQVLPIFRLIQEMGAIDEREMFHVFNMGIGMVLVAPAKHADAVVSISERHGVAASVIGDVVASDGGVELC